MPAVDAYRRAANGKEFVATNQLRFVGLVILGSCARRLRELFILRMLTVPT
jgi:hypothetical protein